MRELVQIHIGQCGVQVGTACWELACLEHGISPTGHCCTKAPKTQRLCDLAAQRRSTFFVSNENDVHIPRALMVDLDPTVIDEVRMGKFKDIFPENHLLSGLESAASNFARGYFSAGKEMYEEIKNRVNRMAEPCENLQGFIVYHGAGGGTGSGVGGLIGKILSDGYAKNVTVNQVVWPSRRIGASVVEPYNAVLTAHTLLQHSHLTIPVDNEAIYDICQTNLKLNSPTYCNLNRLVAQATSSLSLSFRFDGPVHQDLASLRNNLVPFPRLNWVVMSYAPFSPIESKTNVSVSDLAAACFNPSSSFSKNLLEDGKYIATACMFRGEVTPSEVNDALVLLKNSGKPAFVPWSPTGFKCSVSTRAPTMVPGGDLAKVNAAVCAASNATNVRHSAHSIIKKFDELFSRSYFLHHFIGDGIEPGEFTEARENLMHLVSDYEMVESDNLG